MFNGVDDGARTIAALCQPNLSLTVRAACLRVGLSRARQEVNVKFSMAVVGMFMTFGADGQPTSAGLGVATGRSSAAAVMIPVREAGGVVVCAWVGGRLRARWVPPSAEAAPMLAKTG